MVLSPEMSLLRTRLILSWRPRHIDDDTGLPVVVGILGQLHAGADSSIKSMARESMVAATARVTVLLGANALFSLPVTIPYVFKR